MLCFWTDPVICRTLLVSKDGLERAKGLITSYKMGKIQEMSPELWHAKKVVDSTLHPGVFVPEQARLQTLISGRYRRAGLPSFQDVMLCSVELGRHCRHADAWAPGMQLMPTLPVHS